MALDVEKQAIEQEPPDFRQAAQIIAKLGQGPDHPILLSFPEGEYLKGLLCRVA